MPEVADEQDASAVLERDRRAFDVLGVGNDVRQVRPTGQVVHKCGLLTRDGKYAVGRGIGVQLTDHLAGIGGLETARRLSFAEAVQGPPRVAQEVKVDRVDNDPGMW